MAPLSRTARAHNRRITEEEAAQHAVVGNLMNFTDDEPEPIPPPPTLHAVPPPPSRVPPPPTAMKNPPSTVMIDEVSGSIPTLVLAKVDTQAVDTEAKQLVEQAFGLAVVDAPSCSAAKFLYDALGQMEKTIEAHFDPHCKRAHALWKGLTDDRATHLKPVQAAKQLIGQRGAAWEYAEREKEAAALRAREAQAREEQQAELRAEAEALVRQGDVQGAMTLVVEAKTMPAPTLPSVPSSVPEVAGVTGREPWEAVIEDWPTLRKAIGEGKYPELDELLELTVLGPLNRLVPTLKTTISEKYPGVIGRVKPGWTRTGRK